MTKLWNVCICLLEHIDLLQLVLQSNLCHLMKFRRILIKRNKRNLLDHPLINRINQLMNSLNLMWHMYVQCDVMISWVLEDPQDWKYIFGGQFYISRAWLRVPCQNMNTHRKLPPTHQKLFKCLRGDLYSSVIHH